MAVKKKTPTKGRPPKPHVNLHARFDANILSLVDKAAKEAKLTRTRFLEIAAEEKLARDAAEEDAGRQIS